MAKSGPEVTFSRFSGFPGPQKGPRGHPKSAQKFVRVCILTIMDFAISFGSRLGKTRFAVNLGPKRPKDMAKQGFWPNYGPERTILSAIFPLGPKLGF